MFKKYVWTFVWSLTVASVVCWALSVLGGWIEERRNIAKEKEEIRLSVSLGGTVNLNEREVR